MDTSFLGHEGSGEVIKKHKTVTKFNVGDNVILSWIKSNGIDASGAEYKTINGEKINSGPITTFSKKTTFGLW